jgi:hypothetical protein
MLKKHLGFPSITLLTLPYLIYYLPEFLESNFFKISFYLGYIALLFSIDILIRKLKYNIKIKLITDFIIWSLCLYIFYGFILTEKIQSFIISQFDFIIRGRFISIIWIFAIILVAIFLKPQKYYFINTFLIILISVNLIYSGVKLFQKKKEKNITLQVKNISKHKLKPYLKPIILIILDEYSSPNELFKITTDSALFDFSKSLKKNTWVTRDNSFSYEVSTIHSLGSIFNYNLSNNNIYSSIPVNNISNYFISPNLINDLETNNIKFINWGIFELKDLKPLTRLYFYPKNIIELIFQYSAIYNIIGNTNLSFKGLDPNYYPMAYHNKWLFENLTDSLKKIKEPAYIYTHFFMPHAPIHYFNEFVSTEKNSTLKYIEYWKFTNKKLRPILKRLGNHYRIILTGDHGFRGNRNINAHNTFSAFLGFTNKELENLKSVQDFGKIVFSN